MRMSNHQRISHFLIVLLRVDVTIFTLEIASEYTLCGVNKILIGYTINTKCEKSI